MIKPQGKSKKAILLEKLRAEEEFNRSDSALTKDVPEKFPDPLQEETAAKDSTSANWSAPENRSEDLINQTDLFTQPDELNTQLPPELIQQRAYELWEHRGRPENSNLADWFEAEAQLRGEIVRKPKKMIRGKS